MFAIVIPILFVIVVGFVYGRRKNPSAEAEAHINRYVMYITLPCMIFLAVAKSSVEQLSQTAFLGAGFFGIPRPMCWDCISRGAPASACRRTPSSV